MSFEKKVYTVEDNVRHIAFGVKDLVKEIKELKESMSHLVRLLSQKNGDEKEFPF